MDRPTQWRSQNRVVARAQVGQHVRSCAMCGKVSVRKHTLLGGSGGMPHLEFRTSEIASAGFSGQVSVAKIIHIFSIQEALLLLFSLFLLSFDRVLTLSRAALI